MRRALAVLPFLWLAACGTPTAGTPEIARPLGPESPAEKAEHARCCAQCTASASRDPAGMDLTHKSCVAYPADWNGGAGVDAACHEFFMRRSQLISVGDCRRLEAPAPSGGETGVLDSRGR